jgi:hypothetical protein
MELLIFVVGMIVGGFIGHLVTVWILKDVIQFYAEKHKTELGLDDELAQKPTASKKIHKLKIEAHGDQLYCFEVDTDNFVCQATTIEEIAKLSRERKQINTAAVIYNDTVFAFVDGVAAKVSK